MNFLLSHLKQLDWILIACAIMLVVFGLISLYSCSLSNGDFFDLHKQIIFLAIGVFLMLVFSFFDTRVLQNNPYLISILYFLCLAALAGLFFFAPEIRGVKSWYKLGPISLDPIEPMKIVLILMLAKYFSMRHTEMYKIRHIFISGIYFAIPSVLIAIQPDLGSAMILCFIWLGILIVSGIKLRHFLILCLVALMLFSLGWSSLEPYQKERITSFVSTQIMQSNVDPLGASWSKSQSEIAIGSGAIFGAGLGHGSQTQYGFLSEPKTDFIFAAIAEEFGLVGVVILFSLFCFLIWRIFRTAMLYQNNFSRLFGFGFGVFLITHIFINIGMNLGLLPIIGIPLPFVSYGGSHLIMAFIGLGILQSIKIYSVKH
jgi:rod shape determining protein RodA